MKFDPPILSRGGLSGRIYVITHGKEEPHPNAERAAQGHTLITASVKYDVTEQYEALREGEKQAPCR
jgi:hypothetical protein